MGSGTERPSKAALWTGRVITGLVTAFLIFDGSIHLTKIAPVVQGFAELGFPLRLGVSLGIIELICIALYVCPRTSVLGALFLTGYLGGAVAVQLRVGHPLFAETLFPVYVAVLLWGGLYLRDRRVRAVVPILRNPAD
jgi:DoxX-like family